SHTHTHTHTYRHTHKHKHTHSHTQTHKLTHTHTHTHTLVFEVYLSTCVSFGAWCRFTEEAGATHRISSSPLKTKPRSHTHTHTHIYIYTPTQGNTHDHRDANTPCLRSSFFTASTPPFFSMKS